MKKRSIKFILLPFFIFGLLMPGNKPLLGQEKIFQHKKWSIGISMDIPLSGLNQSLEDAMRDKGFGDAYKCFFLCSGNISHPHSMAIPVFNFNVEYQFRSNLYAGTFLGWADKGEVNGYDNGGNYGHHLYVKHSSIQFIPYLKYKPDNQPFFFYGGAGIYKYSTWQTGSSQEMGRNEKSNLNIGWKAGTGFYLFNKKRAFMTAKFEYAVILGDIEIGPFEDSTYNYGAGYTTSVVFPSTSVSTSIFTIGLNYARKF